MRIETLNEADMNYQFFILPSIKIDWMAGIRVEVAFWAWSVTWVITETYDK